MYSNLMGITSVCSIRHVKEYGKHKTENAAVDDEVYNFARCWEKIFPYHKVFTLPDVSKWPRHST